MTIPLTLVRVELCRHFVLFTHVNFEYCEFRHFEKEIFCLRIWQALCLSIFSILYAYPQRCQYRFNSRLLLLNAIKKKKKPTTTTRKTAKNKNKQILITPVKKHIWNSLLDTFKTHFTIESHEKKLN